MDSNENELSEFNGNLDDVQELPLVACNVDISTSCSDDSSTCNTPTRPTPTEVQPAVAKDMFYAKRGKATTKGEDRQVNVKPGCSKTPDQVERPSRQLFFGSPPGRARPPLEGADSPFKAPSPSKDWGKLYLRDKKKATSQAESVQPSNETSCMGRSSKQAPNTNTQAGGGSPGSGGYSFWLTSEMNNYYSYSHALNNNNNLFLCRYCPGHKTFSVHETTNTNLVRHYQRFGLINYLTISKYYVKCMHNYIVFKTSYQLLMKMIM